MSGLTSVQKNRLLMTIRELRRAPEWADIKRFIQAAASAADKNEVHEVCSEICDMLFDAVNAEKLAAIDRRAIEP